MSELTKQGYDLIIEKINDMTFEAPTILTSVGLQIWIDAIYTCQKQVIEIIESIRDQYGR